MKIGIVGSRNFPNLGIVAEYVRKLPQGTIIVSGGARGVDHTAAAIAHKCELTVEEFIPNWNEHGTAAGFVRNDEIVNASARIVAFWDGQSGGTLDTIEKARAAGVPVTVISPNGSHFDEKPTNENAFDDTDPQDGSTRDEYEDARARDEAADYALPKSDHEGKPKVKLLTTSLKWICAAKTKTRKTKSGRTHDYFTQAFFTTRGNRVIVTYDVGALPLSEGPARGIVVEIFGCDIQKNANDDKTQTAIIFGAEVFKRAITEQKKPREFTPAKPQTPEKPKPTEADRERAKYLTKLRTEYSQLARALEYDDRDEIITRGQLEELGMKIYYVERGINSAPADRHVAGAELPTETAELRTLIKEQNADRFGSVSVEIDEDASDVDENTAADILDADADGAEIARATEPWADSSAPIGATVDADCWDCPSRLGACCMKATIGEACIFA